MRTATLLLAALCLLAPSAPSAPATPERPNILWLVSEDNDPFLGCYGDPMAHTPTIDRLAREGVLYERCFAQPVCAPSRFTLITGTFAATAGPAEHMRAMAKIPDWLKGFPTYLSAAGYFTTNNAKTDYNSHIDPKTTWSKQGKEAHWRNRPDAAQPFFSVFNHEVTHESCLFPEQELPLTEPPIDPAKVRIPPYQPDTPEIRADWARYYNHMALLDAQLAAKLDDLKKDGLAENTIVFYYADNGGVLARGKRFLEQSGTHVPLIVYYPPKWRHLAPAAPGSRISDPVCFADFAPTVLSLAGLEIPRYMQGHAFAGPAKAAPPEFVYCTRDRMDERYDMMRSVMDKRWLYIRNFRPDMPYVQHLEYQFKARGYQSWARMAEEGKLTPATAQFWGQKPPEELYDMEADPDSVHNLAADPVAIQVLSRMKNALRAHMLEIKDNGLLPEGSPLEGYEESRAPGAWPIEDVYATAVLASNRDAANLPMFIRQLSADPSEPMRWWSAQGCTMLGLAAAPAEAALRKALQDSSPYIQVAAAEAMGAIGKADEALPVLQHWIESTEAPFATLQAANVLDRFGDRAKPLLATMKKVQAGIPKPAAANSAPAYLERMLDRIIAVLDGREKALIYPQFSAKDGR